MATSSPYAICFKLSCALWLSGLSLLGAGSPAQAAGLPGADRSRSQLSLGSGPSLGVSWQAFERFEFGAGVAAPFYFGPDFGTLRYSLYSQYQLLNQDGFYMGVIAGIYGDLHLPEISRYSAVGLQFGATLAYDLNRDLTLRLNIVPGISLLIPPEGWIFFPPVGGVALAWRPLPQLETSLGFNGNGDILAASWLF